jgi:predicted ATP-dependent endonuclease of OLD family
MKITIENFLAFSEPVTFDLKKINLFIGANNCGKSTFAKFIEILQHSRFDNGEIDLSIPKKLDSELSCFNDLLNQQLQFQKQIVSKFEFQRGSNKFVLEIAFKERKNYHIDNYGKKHGGIGEIINFQLNGCNILTSSEEQLILSYSGLNLFDSIPKSEYNEELSNNENNDQLLRNYLLTHSGIDIELWKATDTLDFNSISSFHGKRFITFLQNEVLQILRNTLSQFGLISNNSATTELYRLEREWVDNQLKQVFDIEIIERELILKSASKDGASNYVDTMLFFKSHNCETPLEAMGLGFQTLIRFLMTTHGEGFDRHLKQTQLFPILQEPEIGLHPDWQVKLFKLLVSKLAIIETHSLVILRALQLEVAEGNYDPEDVLIHNFYRDNNNVIRINPIRINKTGMLLGEFAKGFHEEISDIEMKLWQIQQKQINQN